MGYSTDRWGGWYSVLILEGEPMEPRSVKNHPRFSSQAERGGEVARWVFPVLASSSWVFPIMWFLILWVAHGAPHPTSEKLALTRRGQVTGCLPTLRPFRTQASLMPFPELRSRVLVPFCQAVLITWALPLPRLLAHRVDHFPLPTWKGLWRVLLLTPGHWWGRQKALVWPLLPCTGVKRTALLARQWARLCGSPLSTGPARPQHLAPRESQPDAAGRHMWVSVSDPQWCHNMIHSRGCSPDCSAGYAVCVPYLGIRFLGQVALNLSKGCCPSTASEWSQRLESIILMQTSQSLCHPPSEAGVSPEPSGYVQVEKAMLYPIWVTRNFFTNPPESVPNKGPSA